MFSCRVPGDCNESGSLDISDAICIFGTLFLGSPSRYPCGDGESSDPANVALLGTLVLCTLPFPLTFSLECNFPKSELLAFPLPLALAFTLPLLLAFTLPRPFALAFFTFLASVLLTCLPLLDAAHPHLFLGGAPAASPSAGGGGPCRAIGPPPAKGPRA